jgi:hypothetical protein
MAKTLTPKGTNMICLSVGLELDRAVAEKVMELEVVGELPCAVYDGCWRECQEAPMRLLYLERQENGNCYCEFRESVDRTYFGHIHLCLDVVPPYSTDIAAAWQVVEKMMATHERVQVLWYPSTELPDWECTIDALFQCGHTAPVAICRAALAMLSRNTRR